MTRGALLIALSAIFALLFSAFAQLYYLPAPAMLVLGVSVTPEQGAPFTQQTREDILRFYRARECRVPFNEEPYGRMANRFAADPDRYEFHFISLGALLTRV